MMSSSSFDRKDWKYAQLCTKLQNSCVQPNGKCSLNYLPMPRPLSCSPAPCAMVSASEGRVLVELTEQPDQDKLGTPLKHSILRCPLASCVPTCPPASSSSPPCGPPPHGPPSRGLPRHSPPPRRPSTSPHQSS